MAAGAAQTARPAVGPAGLRVWPASFVAIVFLHCDAVVAVGVQGGAFLDGRRRGPIPFHNRPAVGAEQPAPARDAREVAAPRQGEVERVWLAGGHADSFRLRAAIRL